MNNVNEQDASSKYKHLWELIHNGMQRSRKALDTSQLVQDCYGDDAAIFGGTDMLVNVMESMLDKMHECVEEELVEQFLQTTQMEADNNNNNIPSKLQVMEHIL
jgi:hypothetical protein